MAWLATALACGGSGSEPGNQRLEGYRSKAPFHKVQLSAQQAAELEKHGAKVLGDYGSYKLVQVDDATLDSLSPAKGAELRDDYDHILLNAGVIDTASEYAKSQRGMVKKAAGKGFHIVHFDGPVKAEWLEELKATGVRVVTYIPNNAYLVYGDVAAMGSLQKHIAAAPAIRWDGEYLNDYKLDPTVQTVATPAYSIQLIKDEETNGATLELIRKLQTREAIVQEALDYVNVVAFVDRQALNEIVQRADVLSIQPRLEPRKFDERQNMIIAGQLTGNVPSGATYLNWLASKGFTQAQFTASGFGVDVSDSGIDNGTSLPNHFGLYLNGDVTGTSRVVYNRLEGTANSGSTLQGCDGHGNLNSHIVAGFSNQSGAPFADAAGFHYGLGVAPFVKVGSSVVFDPGTFTSPNYENLQSRAFRDGMRISTNSWGSNANTYNSDAQRYDALVRDAQPASAAVPAAGNQEMIIVFAAGNQGSGANTVGSPGTAKNVITVGASENVQAFGGADGCGTTDTEANSAYDIVAFSSRGPASDGRKKPDIMAPGTHVSGGVAQTAGQRASPPAIATGQALSCFDATGVCAGPSSNYFPVTQQWYTASSGTSHSTPAVAGATALLRQYFINQGVTPPSPAMTKAYLMNSTRYMTGVGANDSLYSNNQGMGLMDLGMAFDGVPRLLDDQNPANLFTATGQSRTFSGVVADSTKPFRVTVAWTDAPGSTTGSAWKNNLDLSVTVGTTTYKGNVFTGANSTTGGTADSSNNVESVFLPAGIEGAYTVTVAATNVTSDGVPNNASSLDQDFALVAYNSCATATLAPTGTTATVNGNNRIDVSWTENGSASYNIYRATAAGGPYTRVGTSVASPFSDTGLSGGTTYYYVVRAMQCSESPKSNESSVTATGVCTLPPTFAGLTSAANGAASTCSNTLSWSAATPICGGAISYSVFRSATPGFVPSAANRVATGVTGTSFADDANLSNGTPYYYVVRATEVSSASNEDTNTVEKAATPTGVITPGVRYFDDFDSSRPANASAYWIPTAGTGSASTMAIVSGCRYQSATNAYRFGAATTTCGGTYPVSQQHTLVLGGNGSVSSTINGFSVPTGAFNPQMTFNVWYSFESRYDGAWLVYSTSGASGPWINVGDAAVATAPYISAGGYDNTLNSSTTTRIWTTTTAGSSGTNGALKAVTVNLGALAGQKVWFGFKFYSDSSTNQEGFYVDDVRINADTAGSCSTNVPPPGPAVAYKVTGLPSVAQVTIPTSFSVTAVDAAGVVATGYNGSASFTSTDSAAVLPATATFTAGVASGLPVTFNTGGDQSITATDVAAPAIKGTGSTFVTTATKLVFTTQPTNSTAGATFAPKVGLQDKDGNAVTTGSFSVTLSIANNVGGGSLSGTTTVAMSGGVATFSGLSIDKVGTGYTLKATASGLTDATSSAFNITAATASKLAFATQPSATVVGSSIAPAVQVAVQDAFGNQVTSTASITVALSGGSGATLSGTATVAAVGGIATFGNLSINKVGTDYKLTATSGTLTSATSSVFSVTPGAPYRVLITRQPSNVVAGASMSPSVQVSLYDQLGNLATQASNPVTLSLGYNTTGAVLGGVTTANAVAGVATFDSLSVSRAGTNYTLVAGASGLYQDTSVSFNVSEGPSAKLAFRAPPANAVAGSVIAPVTVELQDGQGNLNTAATAQVTLSLGGPSGGVLGGTSTVTAINGVATFSDLKIERAASGYTLHAEATGLTGATSGAFSITPGAAAALAFSAQPGSVVAGASFAPSVKVSIVDAFGNVVTGAQDEISLALASPVEGSTLTGNNRVVAINGVAIFTGLTITRVGAGYTLVASAGSLAGATSSAFEVLPSTSARLAFKTSPAHTTAGAVLGTVEVQILDIHGNVVPATNVITLKLEGGSGASLGGTTAVSAVAGVASFGDLSITQASAGYRLTAHAEGMADVSSSAFDVSPGAAAALAFSVQPGTAQAGATVGPAVRVSILDAYGNVVTSASDAITLALSANPGSSTLTGTTTVASVNGVATFADLSLNRAAKGYTLQASTASLTATSAAFDITGGAPARLVFRNAPGNISAGATLAPIEVELQDAQGNVLTDSKALVTLSLGANPAAGTLLGSAPVSAVAGVAKFEGLSLRKAGTGYTLVASAQGFEGAQSAAFNVTPGSAASFALVFPASVTAGQEATLSATAYDAYGNVATSYAGPAKVTSSDEAAALSANATFVEGVLSGLKITFKSSGLKTLTLTDAAEATLTGVAQTNVTPYAQPTVSVTEPAGGTEVSGEVRISATGAVAAGTTLSQISILVDGVVIATGKDATLTATWDSSKVESGSSHTITAVISDSAGNVVGSAPVGITVKNEGCGCGATSGTDASIYMGLFALARYVTVRRRQTKKAA
ncbi:S8 family serine peptidase [Vitiosangium sp. GDMCC 1.1324]|uniref:S8 family serine peptidase n=1 Tax=Vitiosangium sp. (strain GDMCC 1.1324) TaxID=2138576 RepID=UPI001E40765C|nr:S8 family serine peptidase [Vitiosangium sp. GDMCC 1.1324]